MTVRGKSAWSVVSGYFVSTRAGATAVTSILLSLAAFTGVGFAGDYLTLMGQRDLLKSATNAGTVAAIKHFASMDLANVNDEELETTLRSVVERYLLANLPTSKRQRASETLELTVLPNRASRTVGVSARADLGGILFLDGLLEQRGDPRDFPVGVQSGAVGHNAASEVVLAIDVTVSMFFTLTGENPFMQDDYADYPAGQYPFTRMNIVKAAAKEVVSILNADGNGAAIGIVPWHFRVRLGPGQRERWLRENWARYADQRTYPDPYRGAPAGGETATMPPAADREPWRGCVDQRALTGTPPPALSPALPTDHPFTMAYYSPESQTRRIGFSCRPRRDQNYCYDPAADASQFRHRLPPQDTCDLETLHDNGNPAHIVPLTTNHEYLHSYIDRLRETGPSTYSSLGIVWALRLLDPTWRPFWGDPVFPRDRDAGEVTVNKAIVLLTDGEDNRGASWHLQTACTAAKNVGVRIFVVAAMNVSKMTNSYGFVRQLRRCSSNADFPEVEHVFINNATPEALRDSFRTIANQIQKFRLTN